MFTYFLHTSVTPAASSWPQHFSTNAPRDGNTTSTESKSALSSIPVRPVLVYRPLSRFDCPGFLKTTQRVVPISLFCKSVKNIFDANCAVIFFALKILLEPVLVLIASVSQLSSPSIFQIHSFSNRLTPKSRLCGESNLKVA